MARTTLDPAGPYGSDPDYEDYINAPFDRTLSQQQNKGTIYETALFSAYRDRGMTPAGFSPAGSDATAPDLKLWLPKYTGPTTTSGCKEVKIEVKLDWNVDFGQSSLTWKGNGWALTGKEDTASQEMRRLLNSMGVTQKIAQVWKGKPNLFKYKNSSQVPGNEKQADLQNYPSSYIHDDSFIRTFAAYYKRKGVNYIQIGGSGLWYLGDGADNENKLAYIGAKSITACGASMKLRIRTKASASAGTYRFSTALLIDVLPTRNLPYLDLANANDMNRLQGDAIWSCNSVQSLVRQRV